MKDEKKKPRICLSDSTLNTYGYRVLTSGLDIEAFKSNPVMLYMHLRDSGMAMFGENRAIGHWEDIRIEGDVLSAVPVFDCVDDLSKDIAAKFEAGTYNAASIGFKILETSTDPAMILPGQTRATVTKAKLMEASIVDIPGNGNAVRLFNSSAVAQLAAIEGESELPALVSTDTNTDKMNIKDSWKTITSFLGVKSEEITETSLSTEMVDKVEDEMTRLKADVADKEAEIAQLKAQIEALKAQPAEEVTDPAPAVEPIADEDKEDLAAFCDSNEGNARTITERLRKEGLLK